ncbi:MAG: uroporphyrinogen decarboxylase family protein [Anaerolineae bacterium]
MTPRERILAALHHEVPDHTPTYGWFHHEVQRRLKEHYRTDDWEVVLRALGIEGWAGISPWIDFPEFEAKAELRPGPLPGRPAIWIDERTHEDGWGVRHRLGEGGWYEEWVGGPLVGAQSVADIESAKLPTPEQVREPEDYAGKVAALKAQDLFVSAGIANPYLMAWNLRGMDNVLADYLINRDMLEALYDRLYAVYSEMTRRMARAGVDMISVTGDIAMQDRIIMGPKSWRAVDKPRMAKLIADCRAINPDVYFYIHSDGNVMDLMDDIVEIGFNVVNPIQPECMDPAEVKRRWGDRITLHGGISLQRTLPNGTPAEVRYEVEELIRKCGYDGGLVVFPSNVIQPDTTIENIVACFHAARDFDVASLGGKPG